MDFKTPQDNHHHKSLNLQQLSYPNHYASYDSTTYLTKTIVSSKKMETPVKKLNLRSQVLGSDISQFSIQKSNPLSYHIKKEFYQTRNSYARSLSMSMQNSPDHQRLIRRKLYA